LSNPQPRGPMNLIPLRLEPATKPLLAAFFKHKSPATLKAYRQDLEDLRLFLGHPSLEAAGSFVVTRSHGQANLLALKFKAHLKAKGLTPATVNRKLAGLRSLVKLANTLGLIPWKLEVPNEPSESYQGPCIRLKFSKKLRSPSIFGKFWGSSYRHRPFLGAFSGILPEFGRSSPYETSLTAFLTLKQKAFKKNSTSSLACPR